jgi:hypothetical protein
MLANGTTAQKFRGAIAYRKLGAATVINLDMGLRLRW